MLSNCFTLFYHNWKCKLFFRYVYSCWFIRLQSWHDFFTIGDSKTIHNCLFELNCLFQSLVIDQTIEKVSFCTPDPGNDRVFSYICREGTTRRWMCHSFLALRDTVSWHSNLPSTLWFKVLLVLKIVRPLSCDQCPVTQRQRKKDGLVWNFKIKGENWITTYLTCRWKLNDEMIPISLLYAHFFSNS